MCARARSPAHAARRVLFNGDHLLTATALNKDARARAPTRPSALRSRTRRRVGCARANTLPLRISRVVASARVAIVYASACAHARAHARATAAAACRVHAQTRLLLCTCTDRAHKRKATQVRDCSCHATMRYLSICVLALLWASVAAYCPEFMGNQTTCSCVEYIDGAIIRCDGPNGPMMVEKLKKTQTEVRELTLENANIIEASRTSR